MTLLLRINPSAPDPAAVARAAAALRAGGIIILPTETVYGIGGDGSRAEVVRRIYAIKGRSEEKPLVRLAADWKDLEDVIWRPETRKLAEAFWPGPLTLVLSLLDGRVQGFRFPDHPLTRAIVRAAGVSFVATSANRSGEPPAADGEEAEKIFGGEADLILNGGKVGGTASTVLDLSVSPPRLLREGPVSREDLETVWGRGIL